MSEDDPVEYQPCGPDYCGAVDRYECCCDCAGCVNKPWHWEYETRSGDAEADE